MELDWQQGHNDLIEWGTAFFNTVRTGNPLPPLENVGAENREWPMAMFLELALIQFALNFGIRLLIVQPIAKRLMLANTKRPKKVTHSRVVKFSQATLETIFYSVYFAMGYQLVKKQTWLWPSAQWWENQPDNRFINDDQVFFYIAYAARYLQAFIAVFLEPKRKDFWEMQAHHSTTVLLIYLSYTYGFVRVGLVIMVLLDIADPPLHLAKQCVYVKEVGGGKLWSIVADIFFAIFAVVFTVTRMGLYAYVTYSCTIELYTVKYNGPFDLAAYTKTVGIETIMCVILVWILQLLQVFWWLLLAQAVKKVLLGQDLKDERSDSEHSDYEDNGNKKTN